MGQEGNGWKRQTIFIAAASLALAFASPIIWDRITQEGSAGANTQRIVRLEQDVALIRQEAARADVVSEQLKRIEDRLSILQVQMGDMNIALRRLETR